MKKLLLATLTACGVWLGAQAQNTTLIIRTTW